jgi:flagellin
MLHRMRVLAVRASTDTVNDDQRADMGTELDQIKATYTQNLTKTFNGKRLFTNSRSGVIQDVVFQVGIDDKDSNRVRLVPDSIEKLWLEKLTRINLSNQGKSQFSLAIIDDVMANLSVDRSVVGAVSNRVGEAIQSTNDSVVLGTAAESQIRDADFAQETSELTKAEIVASTSVALMSQVRGMREMALQLL